MNHPEILSTRSHAFFHRQINQHIGFCRPMFLLLCHFFYRLASFHGIWHHFCGHRCLGRFSCHYQIFHHICHLTDDCKLHIRLLSHSSIHLYISIHSANLKYLHHFSSLFSTHPYIWHLYSK